MIGSVISAELLKLRRSWTLLLTFALAAIGPVLAGAVTWSARALEGTDVALPLPAIDVTWEGFLGPGLGYSGLFLLLALTIATAHLFGSEYQDDTVEITMAGTVRTERLLVGRFVVLLGWAVALAVFVFALGVTVGFGVGLGAVSAGELSKGLWLQVVRIIEILAGLPVIAWVAIRSRGMIVAISTGVLASSTALLLRTGPVSLPVPWSMGAVLFAGGSLWSTVAAPIAVFLVATALCLIDLRARDVV